MAVFADQLREYRNGKYNTPLIVTHDSALEALQYLLFVCDDEDCRNLETFYAVKVWLVPPCTEVDHDSKYCQNVIRSATPALESLVDCVPRPYRK